MTDSKNVRRGVVFYCSSMSTCAAEMGLSTASKPNCSPGTTGVAVHCYGIACVQYCTIYCLLFVSLMDQMNIHKQVWDGIACVQYHLLCVHPSMFWVPKTFCIALCTVEHCIVQCGFSIPVNGCCLHSCLTHSVNLSNFLTKPPIDFNKVRSQGKQMHCLFGEAFGPPQWVMTVL